MNNKLQSIKVSMPLYVIARLTVILSILPSIFMFFLPGKIVGITIVCSYPLILLMFNYLLDSPKLNIDGILFIKLFTISNLLILGRGIIDAQTQQDWATLLYMGIPLGLFIPFCILFGTDIKALKMFLSTFLRIGIIMSSILYFKGERADLNIFSFDKNVSAIYLFILFIPYVNKKWKYFIIALALISFLSSIQVRANMLNIIVAFLISLSFYFRQYVSTQFIIKFFHVLIITSPIVFLILGLFGIFNIFLIGEILGDYTIESAGGSQEVLVDSRSGIYTDVFSELEKDSSYIWGLGGSGKTETFLTDSTWADFDVIYKEGRRGTESGMLNYIQWGGAVGAIIYFLLFLRASFLGIYKSNNWLSVMLGLWVAYKGLFSFIEDRIWFNFYSILILLSIGMCFNKPLRMMSEKHVSVFIKSLFEKKYDRLLIRFREYTKLY